MRAHLDQLAVGPQPSQRERRLGPRPERDRRSDRQLLQARAHDRRQHPWRDQVGIVEHEHEAARQRADQTGECANGVCLPVEVRGRLRLDPVTGSERVDDRSGRQLRGISRAWLEHDPDERSLIALGPFAQDARLAISRRRDHDREKGLVGLDQPAYQPRTPNQPAPEPRYPRLPDWRTRPFGRTAA
jgi:hypothetical protein